MQLRNLYYVKLVNIICRPLLEFEKKNLKKKNLIHSYEFLWKF